MTIVKVPDQVRVAAPGITYRKLDYWVRAGYLRPTNPAPGSGEKRVWTSKELEVARIMVLLTKVGLSVGVSARIARLGPGKHELAPGLFIDISE